MKLSKKQHIRKRDLKPETIQVRIAKDLDDRVAKLAEATPCFKLSLFNKFIAEGLEREAAK
jgi:hypothetical protein